MLMCARVPENACPACFIAGTTTSLSSARSDGSLSSMVPATRKNIVDRDVAALTCQFVSAMWAAHAFEDAVTHQRLQHRVKLTRQKGVSGRQCLGRHWAALGIMCDIDNRSDGKDALARHKKHEPFHSEGRSSDLGTAGG